MKPEAPETPFRVLVVDDNRDAADSAVLLLRVVGFEVCACYNGHEALLKAPTLRPNVCLIDLNMPGMDGDELAQRLRKSADWHPLLLVALTAMSSEQDRLRIANAGFHMHMVKPADPFKLVAVVDALFHLRDPSDVAAKFLAPSKTL